MAIYTSTCIVYTISDITYLPGKCQRQQSFRLPAVSKSITNGVLTSLTVASRVIYTSIQDKICTGQHFRTLIDLARVSKFIGDFDLATLLLTQLCADVKTPVKSTW
jgi:hypothetical protein